VQTFTGSGVPSYGNDYVGHGIAISGDGMTMAIGVYGGEANGISAEGYVNIYKRYGVSWSFFQRVTGTGKSQSWYEYFGASVDLSHNGTIMAALSCTPAALRIYELNASLTMYTEVGQTIYMNANWGEHEAVTVAVSPSGGVVGALAPHHLNARIFERDGNEYKQKGADIVGFQESMSFNFDGSVVVVGSNNRSGGSNSGPGSIGRVGVFKWNDTLWELMGDYVSEYTGVGDRGCVSITYDGKTVIVGTRSGNGLVRAYTWDGHSWNQKGNDVVGSGNAFSITDVSSDGDILVVGAIGSQGYVYTYQWDGSNYVQFGQTIQGEGGVFGYALSVSADASTVAVGAWRYNDDYGKAYVYDLDLPPSPPSSIMPSLPPTPKQVSISYEYFTF